MIQKLGALLAVGVSIAFIGDGVFEAGSSEVAIAGIGPLAAAAAVLRGRRTAFLAAG